ncbi:uncharacterized protein LOC109949802 isoform X3 [Prunus persica]|uniref:uncharacterized protein LOC109949802 isoform X3 n=1 Tax=Prunus persica TaxID=3760 RepID=UPI0009AB2E63|nr:uncharacterized protein LOC109949802 isoform X3 [Prunus persica]
MELQGYIRVVVIDCSAFKQGSSVHRKSTTGPSRLPRFIVTKVLVEILGLSKLQGRLPNFRQESRLKFQLEGQLGQLCPTFAKCRTRTGFDSNSKAKFGSGPVIFAVI